MIPEEIILHISTFCDPITFCNIGILNCRIYRFMKDKIDWKDKIESLQTFAIVNQSIDYTFERYRLLVNNRWCIECLKKKKTNRSYLCYKCDSMIVFDDNEDQQIGCLYL